MQIIRAPRASTIIYSLLIDLGNRSPWLLPANICPIVPITFLKARVPFHFVDISAKTLHMNLEQAEALIKKRKFGGLLYAHTYGEASTPNDFFALSKRFSPDLMLLDDRCLCAPDLEADPANKADVQLYSTGYAKIVELNFGGYAFIRDDIHYQAAHLSFNPHHHEEIEKDLKKSLEQRKRLNQVYASILPAEIQLPDGFQTWRFNIRVKNKQHILEKIFSSGFFASSHYASLADIMDDDRAPHAETLAETVINLFNDHHFTSDQAEQVCKIILENLV